jgi:hypothetical protein
MAAGDRRGLASRLLFLDALVLHRDRDRDRERD